MKKAKWGTAALKGQKLVPPALADLPDGGAVSLQCPVCAGSPSPSPCTFRTALGFAEGRKAWDVYHPYLV
jgi:hypothetical protein